MESDEIPIYRDIGVSKVQNLPLVAWPRLGGRGSYIQLHGTEGKWGAYVVEVPGAGAITGTLRNGSVSSGATKIVEPETCIVYCEAPITVARMRASGRASGTPQALSLIHI